MYDCANPKLAKSLGMLYFGVGGSGAHGEFNPAKVYVRRGKDDSCTHSYDLVGVVESKRDIIELVTFKSRELQYLMGLEPHTLIREGWDLREEGQGWEVFMLNGISRGCFRLSLTLCSREHLLYMASYPDACQFGIISTHPILLRRFYHPRYGHRSVDVGRCGLKQDLCGYDDVDFYHPQECTEEVHPGVLCDLLLTSRTLYDSDLDGSIISAVLQKWKSLSREEYPDSIIPRFYASHLFPDGFVNYLSHRFGKVETRPETVQAIRQVLDAIYGDRRSHRSSLPIRNNKLIESSWGVGPVVLDKSQIEIRSAAVTDHFSGRVWQVRTPSSDWEDCDVKTGPEASLELKGLPVVERMFRTACGSARFLVKDKGSETVLFRLGKRKHLDQIRLNYFNDPASLSLADELSPEDWFEKVELQRAKLLTYVYQDTICMQDPGSWCEGKLYGIFHERLDSNNRFEGFYSETIGGLCADRSISLSKFMKMRLDVNDKRMPCLNNLFDKARKYLDRDGVLKELPVAFGLGDGLTGGARCMVTPGGDPRDVVFIDYQAFGYHCPLLDIAGAIYNDCFWNCFYKDLISEYDGFDATRTRPRWWVAGNSVVMKYDFRPKAADKAMALAKLNHLLAPVLKLVAGHTSKAEQAVAVLSSAMFTCALLTRNFSDRPDLFFLNLAVATDIMWDIGKVFDAAFRWEMPDMKSLCALNSEYDVVRGVAVSSYPVTEKRTETCQEAGKENEEDN